MKKPELIDAVAERCGMKKTAVAAVLDTAFDALAKSLADGDEANLWALGKLKPAVRKARPGRNPKTGEMMEIPERAIVKFVPSKALDELMNP